ncbi:septum formation initiator family protein [Candidatus Thioglobus sp.]|uniref:FtsB family cell division protein n=1 Tax=Candidatus Thioglobus sp. TaxID=2026721 RepID=UPI002612B289|nr:septum formation initiator family protein [Candidatus Thioglobus sp.]MDG2395196.1 septum formation initiator family protein [Candidatus Thioglobus sp.]
MSIKLRLQSAKKGKKKSNNLFGFFYRHWISIILAIILTSLVRQNFIINNFPLDIYEKQDSLTRNITENKKITRENHELKLELAAKSNQKLEILESIARQKFGLIKSNEKYYQISTPGQD